MEEDNETEEVVQNKIGQDFTLFGLLKFTFPAILNNLFSQIFKSLDDGLFVSRYVGKTALAGLNILSPLLFFQFGINNLFTIGGSNISSRKMGQGKQLEAKQVFSRVIISAFAVGSLFALIVNLLASPILDLLGADEELRRYSILSLRTVYLITPISLVGNVFNSYYPTAGKPSMGLFCSILNGAINIILDVILIVVLKMGVIGACISTVAGDVAVFIVGMIFFSDKRNEIYFVPPEGNIIPTTLETWRTGLPQAINSVSFSLSALVINHQMLLFIGNDGVAADSIITDLRRILTASFFGYCSCVGPIVSYAFGHNDPKRLKKLMCQNITLWLGGAFLFTTLGLLLRRPMIGIFIPDVSTASQVFYDQTYLGLTLEFCSILFFAGCAILSRMFIAINLRRSSTVLAIMRNLVFRTLTILVLPRLFGGIGVWLANPVCEFLSFCVGSSLFLHHKKEFGF